MADKQVPHVALVLGCVYLAACHLPCHLSEACTHLGYHSLDHDMSLVAQVGDHVVVDGGMVTLDILEKAGPDVRCQVADPGIILSRANLTFRRHGVIVRARNSMLPVLSSKVCSFLCRALLNILLLQNSRTNQPNPNT